MSSNRPTSWKYQSPSQRARSMSNIFSSILFFDRCLSWFNKRSLVWFKPYAVDIQESWWNFSMANSEKAVAIKFFIFFKHIQLDNISILKAPPSSPDVTYRLKLSGRPDAIFSRELLTFVFFIWLRKLRVCLSQIAVLM